MHRKDPDGSRIRLQECRRLRSHRWVRAGQPEVLEADYASLAEPLVLTWPDNDDSIALLNSVRTWLDQNSRWLLIFDGAKCAVDLEGYLSLGKGKVIVTSANTGWSTTLKVKPLERTEAMALLCPDTGLGPNNQYRSLSLSL